MPIVNGLITQGPKAILSERKPTAYRGAGTQQLHAKLADRTVARHILVVGDSNGEAYGVTKDVNRSYAWWSELQRQIRSMHDDRGPDDNASYFPVFFGSAGNPAFTRAFVDTGTVTDLSNTSGSPSGMGMRAASMAGTTNYTTFTGTGTDFEIFYQAGVSRGSFQVTLDGVAGGTQSTARAGGTLGGRTYSTGLTGLPYRSHTIKIAPTSGSTIVVEGVKVYNNGINSGVHVWDASHGGARATDFNTYVAGSFWDILNTSDAVAGGKVFDHIIIPLGSNEVYGLGLGGTRTAAQYYSDMDTLIGNAITAGYTGGFTIVFPPAPKPVTEATMAPYREQAWRLACTRTNVDFVDLSPAIPSPTDGTSSAPLTVTISADEIHYNDRGSKWVANLVSEAIIPKTGRQVGPVGPPVDVQVFTASGTWTKPSSAFGTYKSTQVICVGGGAGGGSGRKDSTASTVRAGGSGGGGGGFTSLIYSTSVLGATETVTVGAGGAGGAAKTVNATSGSNGVAGGTTSFGAWTYAKQNAFSLGGGGGTGAAAGGLGSSGVTNGAAGASSSATGAAGSGPSDVYVSGSGGGSGGGVTTAQVASAGGAGGNAQAASRAGGTGGAIITAGGTPAVPSVSGEPMGGGGGGGGGSSVTAATNAGDGGAGATYGGGGGGGGASGNTGNSGAGGAGASGIVIVITS